MCAFGVETVSENSMCVYVVLFLGACAKTGQPYGLSLVSPSRSNPIHNRTGRILYMNVYIVYIYYIDNTQYKMYTQMCSFAETVGSLLAERESSFSPVAFFFLNIFHVCGHSELYISCIHVFRSHFQMCDVCIVSCVGHTITIHRDTETERESE